MALLSTIMQHHTFLRVLPVKQDGQLTLRAEESLINGANPTEMQNNSNHSSVPER